MPSEQTKQNNDQPNDADLHDDEELVAYLDGELDQEKSQTIQSKLTTDSLVRDKANALKKTFDLLDYLPKTEPSPEFATKTLTHIGPVPDANSNSNTTGKTANSADLNSHPTTVGQGKGNAFSAWVMAFAAMIAIISGVGLALLNKQLSQNEKEIPAALWPMIARLPYYSGVDDFEFLKQLDKPELFGQDQDFIDTNQSPVEIDRPITSDIQAKLIKQYQELPLVRKQQVIRLDEKLRSLPANETDRVNRVLEQYAIWLDRLSDNQRREILDARTNAERLNRIEMTRSREWEESLPAERKQQLRTMTNLEDRAKLSKIWQEEQNRKNDAWQLAARQWLVISENKQPWPFKDDKLKIEIEDYVKTVFKIDPKETRLTTVELAKLETFRKNSDRDFGLFLYGTYLLELAEKHPSLPASHDNSHLTKLTQLPEQLVKQLQNRKPYYESKVVPQIGKWPEFALLIYDEQKLRKNLNLTYGPSKAADFAEPSKSFVLNNLIQKLTDAQHAELKTVEGKWPDYPNKVIELCRLHDLSLPGVMLPGQPSLWKKYYKIPSKQR